MTQVCTRHQVGEHSVVQPTTDYYSVVEKGRQLGVPCGTVCSQSLSTDSLLFPLLEILEMEIHPQRQEDTINCLGPGESLGVVTCLLT